MTLLIIAVFTLCMIELTASVLNRKMFNRHHKENMNFQKQCKNEYDEKEHLKKVIKKLQNKLDEILKDNKEN
jgi:uncharacterized protein YlxW (UPF0749 family)